MWLELFFRGIIIGLTASIPLGPVGVMCIQRTLSKGLRSGFMSGLGAATADLIYASIAFFSLSMVLSFITLHQMIFQAVGGTCIALVGINIFFSNPAVQIRRNRAGKSSMWQDYISVFLVTIANVAYILVYVALFATFGLSSTMGYFNGAAMLVGVFAGSTGWWFMLTAVINLLRKRFRPRHLLWMNRISGAVITTIGVVAILSMLFDLTLNDLF